MLTASERAQWRTARDTLDGHLISTLDRIMDTAHGAASKEIKSLVLTTLPEVVKAHKSVTAELAAEFYALARTNAGLDDLFTPEPVWDPNEQQIAGSLRWALKPINGETYTDEDYAHALDRVRASMTRLMRQTEAHTVMSNIGKDPGKPRYRRVPEAGACGWCMMLATRGHVYTKDTVGGAHKRFHDRCKCSSEPQYPGEELPPLVQAARKAYYDFYYPDGSGEPSEEGLRQFFDFVEDGGLGDRPRPGRDSKGRYQNMVNGDPVGFTRDDIYVHLRNNGVWEEHISSFNPTRQRGGHLFSHAGDYRKAAQSGVRMRPKTLFPEGYDAKQFSEHVRKTLGDPTMIEPGRYRGTYQMRREFDGMTIVVQIAPTGKKDRTRKPFKVTSAYPVAGDGWRVNRDGSLRRLPETVERRSRKAVELKHADD